MKLKIVSYYKNPTDDGWVLVLESKNRIESSLRFLRFPTEELLMDYIELIKLFKKYFAERSCR